MARESERRQISPATWWAMGRRYVWERRESWSFLGFLEPGTIAGSLREARFLQRKAELCSRRISQVAGYFWGSPGYNGHANVALLEGRGLLA